MQVNVFNRLRGCANITPFKMFLSPSNGILFPLVVTSCSHFLLTTSAENHTSFHLCRFAYSGCLQWWTSSKVVFCDWLCPSTLCSTSVVAWKEYFAPLYCLLVLLCVDTQHFTYQLTSWWRFGLFRLFGYYDCTAAKNTRVSVWANFRIS